MAAPMADMAEGAAFAVTGEGGDYDLHAVTRNGQESVATHLGRFRAPGDALAAASAFDRQQATARDIVREAAFQTSGTADGPGFEPLDIFGDETRYVTRPRAAFLGGGYDIYQLDDGHPAAYRLIGNAPSRDGARTEAMRRETMIDTLSSRIAAERPAFSLDELPQATSQWEGRRAALQNGLYDPGLDPQEQQHAFALDRNSRIAAGMTRSAHSAAASHRLIIKLATPAGPAADLTAGRIETLLARAPDVESYDEDGLPLMIWRYADRDQFASAAEKLVGKVHIDQLIMEEQGAEGTIRVPLVTAGTPDHATLEQVASGTDFRAWEVPVTLYADRKQGAAALAHIVGRTPQRFAFGIDGAANAKTALSKAVFLASSEEEAAQLGERLSGAVSRDIEAAARKAGISPEQASRLIRVGAPRRAGTATLLDADKLVTDRTILFSLGAAASQATGPSASPLSAAAAQAERVEQSWAAFAASAPDKRHYLTAGREQWQEAQAMGARFDLNAQAMYVTESHPKLAEMLRRFGDHDQLRAGREYLAVARDQTRQAHEMGTAYDPVTRAFYIPGEMKEIQKSALRLHFDTDAARDRARAEALAHQASMMERTRNAVGYAQRHAAPVHPRAASIQAGPADASPLPDAYVASLSRDAGPVAGNRNSAAARLPEMPRLAEGSTVLDALLKAAEHTAGSTLTGVASGWQKGTLASAIEREELAAMLSAGGKPSEALQAGPGVPSPGGVPSGPRPAPQPRPVAPEGHSPDNKAGPAGGTPQVGSEAARPADLANPNLRPLVLDEALRSDHAELGRVREKLAATDSAVLQQLGKRTQVELRRIEEERNRVGMTARLKMNMLDLQAGISEIRTILKTRGLDLPALPAEERAPTAQQTRRPSQQNER